MEREEPKKPILEKIAGSILNVESLEERISLQLRTVKSIIYDPTNPKCFEKEFKTLKDLSDRYFLLTNKHYNVDETGVYCRK